MAILHIEGLAYCELKFEGTEKPATANFISSFFIHEGFGKAAPQLVMYLNDASFSLVRELSLYDGSKISIKHGRTTDTLIERKFSIFGMKNVSAANGPRLQVLAILDVPMFNFNVDRKAYVGGSGSVMQQFASEGGLDYDGPGGTDDSQVWLRVNTSLADFSEFVANHGYVNKKSCMSRIVTSTGKLKYKNLVQELAQGNPGEAETFCLNVDGKFENTVRELHDYSVSGVGNTFVAYGHTKGKHTLDHNNQQVVSMIEPSKNGFMLPLNPEIAGLVEARRDYNGYDVGTKPNPASNLHENYVASEHQNIINLSMFSQRLRLLVDHQLPFELFDVVGLKHNELIGAGFQRISRTEGKYILGGKTMAFVNGFHYYEVHDLYRNYVNNPSEGGAASGGYGGGGGGAENSAANTAGSDTQAFNETQSPLTSADLNQSRDSFNARKMGEANNSESNTSSLGVVQEFLTKTDDRKGGARQTPLALVGAAASPADQKQRASQARKDQEFLDSAAKVNADPVLKGSIVETPVQNNRAFAVQELGEDATAQLAKDGAVEVSMGNITETSSSPTQALDGTNSSVTPDTGTPDPLGKNPIGEIIDGIVQTEGDDLNGNEIENARLTELLGPSLAAALQQAKEGNFSGNLKDISLDDLRARSDDPELEELVGTVGDNWPLEIDLEQLASAPFADSNSQGMMSAISSFFQTSENADIPESAANFKAETPGYTGIDMDESLDRLEAFLIKSDPEKFLVENGAEAYAKRFGTLTPKAAQKELANTRANLNLVRTNYKATPVLAITTDRKQRFKLEQPGVTPVVRVIDRTNTVGDGHVQVITKGKRMSWSDFKEQNS